MLLVDRMIRHLKWLEPLHEITEQEVERALKGIENGRLAGPIGLISDI